MMQAQVAQGPEPLLAVRDVSVVFGGIIALNGVSFDMKRGQVLGLIGPNGDGKTTLFNCLSRLYQPSKGEILMEGEEHSHPPAAEDRRNRHRPDVSERRAVPPPYRARQHPHRRPLPLQKRCGQRCAEAAMGARAGAQSQYQGQRDPRLSRPATTSPTARWRAFPSAPRSGSSLAGRLPPNPRSFCSTSPPAASIMRKSTCSAI